MRISHRHLIFLCLLACGGSFFGCIAISADECNTNDDCKANSTQQVCVPLHGSQKCVDVEAPPQDASPERESAPDNEPQPPETQKEIPQEAIPESTEKSLRETQEKEFLPPDITGCIAPIGDYCSQTQGSPAGTCMAGLLCIKVNQTDARCFQECTPYPSLCTANTDGRTSCIQLDPQKNERVCINNKATEGQECGLNNKSQARCEQDPNTPHLDLYCSPTTQKCTKPEVQSKVGDPCNKEGDQSEPFRVCNRNSPFLLACDPNTGTCIKQTLVGTHERCGDLKGCAAEDDVCTRISDSNGNSAMYCLKKCTPSPLSTCPENAECMPIDEGGGACRWTGPLDQNAACQPLDTIKNKIDTTNLCKGGLQCIGLNGTKAICIQIWEGNCQTPGKTCNTGDKCVGLRSATTGAAFGGCFTDCTGGKACPAGLECSANLGDACLGEAPVGPVALGGICSKDTAKITTEGCKKGLFCLGIQNATQGICSADCGADPSACNGATSGTMTCIETNPQTNDRACVFPCSAPGQTCPAGTTCNNAVGVCLP